MGEALGTRAASGEVAVIKTGGMIAVLALGCFAAATSAFALGTDQEPGQKIHVDVNTLPAPYAPPSGANMSRTIPRPAGATLKVPPGFAVNIFADNLGNARNVRVAPNGDV